MNEKAKKYLFDILSAIGEIEKFSQNVHNLDDYLERRDVQLISERLLSIISEAVVRLNKLKEPIIFENTRQITGFRNRIIHDYDEMDADVIFNIIKVHLPKLKIEVKDLLENN
jgi:uncharacterized protein with HEPN domain